jgi:1-deoxy-D-xylulose-5-phosphate reductoisomerase
LKNLVILGSSGSIGQNALWVVDQYPEELKICGLAVSSNLDLLRRQIEEYRPRVVCIADEAAAAKFRHESSVLGVEVVSGRSGLEHLAALDEADIVLNAVVGFAGLRSTLAAARAGKRIALANKESMVAGGELVGRALTVGGGELIPVDSEHSAIFQCLASGRKEDIRRLILTSSGGPFREYPRGKFDTITVEQALKHPTWTMGRKVTIDSATLMNKGLEIIEAAYLFDIPPERIDVVIHPQSVVHSMVEYVDGSIVAQLSRPDMRLPIEFALFYPRRVSLSVGDLDFSSRLMMDFEPPDEDKFQSLRLARKALAAGGTAPAVFNAANEVAVESFLTGRIRFTDIFMLVEDALARVPAEDAGSIARIEEADKKCRNAAREFVLSRSV